ncbi:MAG: alkaline phosphatase PhoX [Candidatus Nanopelagicales bacterium]
MRIWTPVIVGLAGITAITLALPAKAESPILYMEPVAAGVSVKALATSGDNFGGVIWPGTPDGMGALKDKAGNLAIFVTHEFSASNAVAAGLSRANGAASASTVTALNYDTKNGAITAARDLLSSVSWYNYATGQSSTTPVAPAGAAAKDEYGTANHTKALNRFCSANMVQPGELAYRTTDKNGKVTTYGYTGPAFFTGEEGSDESRAFTMDNAGNLIQLPRLGLAAWENLIVAPNTGMSTVVMANEDGSATDSQLWMYTGTKTTEGHWTDKAGLTNGALYVMSVDGIATDNIFRNTVGKNVAVNVNFKPIDYTLNGKAQNVAAKASGTVMARVEDGAFDPNRPNDYYFVTTESNKDPKATAPNPATPAVSRDGGALWRLRYNDVKTPLAGATLTMLLDGSEAPYMSKPDNLTVDLSGNVLIQEDPGSNDQVARIFAYRIADGKVATVAKFVDKYFKVGGTNFITKDEESSGILDVTDMLKTSTTDKSSYYLLDAQVHATPAASRPDLAGNAAALASLAGVVEGGQLLMMTISDWAAVYG